MPRSWRYFFAVLLAGFLLAADKPEFFRLKDIKPGLKAVGRTVFSGEKIEEFQVEILGVLHNIGPKQSVILARLSGGPLEKTGVMAGMSGSPVYIEGKLVGAVALSFPFSKEPIAGITPIEQMAGVLDQPNSAKLPEVVRVSITNVPTTSGTEPRLLSTLSTDLALLPAPKDPGIALSAGQPRLQQIATPLVMSGFTQRTIEQFTTQLHALGLVPMRGGGGGTAPTGAERSGLPDGKSDPAELAPGAMISVQLVRGDLGINADGTVTYRDGTRIYAFGHRFLSAGPTEMPFSTSNVITLLGSTASSFKISTPGKPMGVIRQDRSSGVLGMIGERAAMIPVSVNMRSSRSRDLKYNFEIIKDRYISPFLLQMAVFGTIDATERALGESSLAIRGTINLAGMAPVKVENLFSADAMAPALAAQTTAVPLALLLHSGFANVDVKSVELDIVSDDERRVVTLDQVWASKREVRPGERIEVTAVLRNENGSETMKQVPLEVPPSLSPGPLQITVADGASLNMAEVRELPGGFTPKSPEQLVRAINNLRKNNRLYVRMSRPQTAFLLHGTQFPSPPPSVAQVMINEPSVSSNVTTSRVSTLAETELEALPSVVSGQKTITVTVKY